MKVVELTLPQEEITKRLSEYIKEVNHWYPDSPGAKFTVPLLQEVASQKSLTPKQLEGIVRQATEVPYFGLNGNEVLDVFMKLHRKLFGDRLHVPIVEPFHFPSNPNFRRLLAPTPYINSIESASTVLSRMQPNSLHTAFADALKNAFSHSEEESLIEQDEHKFAKRLIDVLPSLSRDGLNEAKLTWWIHKNAPEFLGRDLQTIREFTAEVHECLNDAKLACGIGANAIGA